jgi:hypothetical protein
MLVQRRPLGIGLGDDAEFHVLADNRAGLDLGVDVGRALLDFVNFIEGHATPLAGFSRLLSGSSEDIELGAKPERRQGEGAFAARAMLAGRRGKGIVAFKFMATLR